MRRKKYLPDVSSGISPCVFRSNVLGWSGRTRCTRQAILERAAGSEKIKSPVSKSDAAIQRGGKLFREYCADCHGAKGNGNGAMADSKRKPADLTRNRTGALSDGEIFWRISKGDEVMPSFEKTFPLRRGTLAARALREKSRR